MNYLIIIVVIAIVVGPVMWMMPSPAQRRKVELRQFALSQGLQIKVCDLPQSHRQEVRKESPVQGVTYRLPLSLDRPALIQQVYRAQRAGQDVEWVGDDQSVTKPLLIAALSNAPSDIVALEFSGAGVACYWPERGGIEAVKQIKQLLVELRNNLRSIEI